MMWIISILANAVPAAPADGSVTLPWFAWSAIGVGLVSAIIFLARGREADRALLLALTRELLGVVNGFTVALKENTALLLDVKRQTENRL
jgi:heme exporter protein D